jgi:hypothetical protein
MLARMHVSKCSGSLIGATVFRLLPSSTGRQRRTTNDPSSFTTAVATCVKGVYRSKRPAISRSCFRPPTIKADALEPRCERELLGCAVSEDELIASPDSTGARSEESRVPRRCAARRTLASYAQDQREQLRDESHHLCSLIVGHHPISRHMAERLTWRPRAQTMRYRRIQKLLQQQHLLPDLRFWRKQPQTAAASSRDDRVPRCKCSVRAGRFPVREGHDRRALLDPSSRASGD